MRAKGKCVMAGANDNEVDDDEDDNHDDDDDEDYEDDDNDGDDEYFVVFFFWSACESLSRTPRPTQEAHPPRNRGVIHTPQPRIERDGLTADYPLPCEGMTNAGTLLSTRAFSFSTNTDNASVCPAKRACKIFCIISAKTPAHLSL